MTPEVTTEAHLLDSPEAGGVAIRGTALRTAGFAVATALGLLSAPLLTRHLGVVQFGRYSAITSLVVVVTVVTEAGLGALATRELATLPVGAQRGLLRNLLGIRLVLSVLGIAAAMTFAAVAGYGRPLVIGTLLCGLGAVTYMLRAMLGLPFAAQLRLGWLTVSEVVQQGVFVGTVLVLVETGAGIVPLLGAAIPGGIVGTMLLARVGADSVVLRPAYERGTWTRILAQTLPIAAAGAIYSLYFRLVLVLMSLTAPEVETGWFALSFRVVEGLVTVPFLIVGSLLPLLARAAKDDRERLAFGFARTFDVCVIAGAGMALVTYAGAPLAMSILTGDATGAPVTVLQIQAATLLAVFVNVCYGTTLIALHRHRELLRVSVSTLVFTLVAAAILVPLAGARGGAVAATAGEFVLLLAYAVTLRRVRPGLHPSPRVLLRVALAVAVATALTRLVHVPVVPNVGAFAIAGLSYLAMLMLVRAIPEELISALLRRDGRVAR